MVEKLLQWAGESMHISTQSLKFFSFYDAGLYSRPHVLHHFGFYKKRESVSTSRINYTRKSVNSFPLSSQDGKRMFEGSSSKMITIFETGADLDLVRMRSCWSIKKCLTLNRKPSFHHRRNLHFLLLFTNLKQLHTNTFCFIFFFFKKIKMK